MTDIEGEILDSVTRLGLKTREELVREAIGFLREARIRAEQAEAWRLADRIRLALKSADGARRHARNKAARAAFEARKYEARQREVKP